LINLIRFCPAAIIIPSIFTLYKPLKWVAIMGGLSLFARQVGRRQESLNSQSGVAAAMVFPNPRILGDAC
jgi:hypothetical protein